MNNLEQTISPDLEYSRQKADSELTHGRLMSIQMEMDQAAAEQNWKLYDNLFQERKQLIINDPNVPEEIRMKVLDEEAKSLHNRKLAA